MNIFISTPDHDSPRASFSVFKEHGSPKTYPCSPCAPNLLHVLVSRIVGYHNLCSPAQGIVFSHPTKTSLNYMEQFSHPQQPKHSLIHDILYFTLFSHICGCNKQSKIDDLSKLLSKIFIRPIWRKISICKETLTLKFRNLS